MKHLYLAFVLLFISLVGCTQTTSKSIDRSANQTQWHKAKVAYLGDSITDKRRIGTKKVYWEYLQDIFQIESYVFAKSGHTWRDLLTQAEELKNTHIHDLSAIIIFAGTNDYNSNTKMGSLYTELVKTTNHNGQQVERKFRDTSYDLSTYYGRINSVISYLKTHFPKQQIIVLTPIHRGFAYFNYTNVQPDERFANAEGLYIDDYVDATNKAGAYWSVPVIDLFSTSGLSPLSPAHAIYFANKETDLLHPNAEGHERIAQSIAYKLLAYPSHF